MKKDLLVQITVNMTFGLSVLFGQSLFGLIFLFTIFLVAGGILLHLIYVAVNDSQQKQQNEQPSTYFEQVSVGTIANVYKELFRIYVTQQDQFLELLACVDPAKSLLFFIIVHILVLWVWLTDVAIISVVWAIYLTQICLKNLYPRI